MPQRRSTRPLAASPPRSSVPPFVQLERPPADVCTHSFPFSQADFNDLATCTADINIPTLGFCRVSMLERTLNVCNGARRAAFCGLWLALALMNVRCNVGFLPRSQFIKERPQVSSLFPQEKHKADESVRLECKGGAVFSSPSMCGATEVKQQR